MELEGKKDTPTLRKVEMKTQNALGLQHHGSQTPLRCMILHLRLILSLLFALHFHGKSPPHICRQHAFSSWGHQRLTCISQSNSSSERANMNGPAWARFPFLVQQSLASEQDNVVKIGLLGPTLCIGLQISQRKKALSGRRLQRCLLQKRLIPA